MENTVHLTIRFLNGPRVYGVRIPEWIDLQLRRGALEREQTKNCYVKNVIKNVLVKKRAQVVSENVLLSDMDRAACWAYEKKGFDIEHEMNQDVYRWWLSLEKCEKGKMKTPCFSRYLNQILNEYFGGKNE